MSMMKGFLWFLMIFSIPVTSCQANGDDKILFTVQRSGPRPWPSNETTAIVIGWDEVTRRFPQASSNAIAVIELNFGQSVKSVLLDADGNKKPEALILEFTFTSNEPIYTFSIQSSKQKLAVTKEQPAKTSNAVITFLTKPTEKTKSRLSEKIVQSTMMFYPDPLGISINAPGQWNYEYGYFLTGVFRLYEQTQDKRYFDYVQQWADHFIDEQGKLDTTQYRVDEYRLDDVLPGRLFLFLYEKTKDEKYKHAADILKDHLEHQPKTKDGGYWHKEIYPYQMWLDGIYMGDVYSTQYATVFQQPKMYEDAIHQIKLIYQHTLDPKTGLLYHGWDESKNKVWAHPEKGTSPEFWGRAIGWYMMALTECLDYIPKNHPERKDVVKIFQDLSASLLKYQDKKSLLWYQVIDKGDQPGNWIETSCSAMFAYAYAKGAHQGILDKHYLDNANKVFGALVNDYVYFDDQGKLYFEQTVKVGTLNPKVSKGDFPYYISTERRINDYKGLASLLMLSLELDKK
jgi:unsaturated rhamnogalacturonyl hydrolase